MDPKCLVLRARGAGDSVFLTLSASGSPPAGKNWPDKLMKKLFYQLYEADIVLEEAYTRCGGRIRVRTRLARTRRCPR